MTPRHFPLERLAQAMRADGVTVEILPDAQGKSARMFADHGYYMGCQASVAHHTAGSGRVPEWEIAYLDGGRDPDKPGYIVSNAYTSRSGVVTLIASGPTYTEGSGGPWGIIPQDKANHVCFSNEIANWGDGAQVYTLDQMRAVVSFHHHSNRIAAELWEWPDDPYSEHRLFAHFEWAPGRKIDPYGPQEPDDRYGRFKWNMDRFRNDVRMNNYKVQGEEVQMKPINKRAYDSRLTFGGGPARPVSPDAPYNDWNKDVPRGPTTAGEQRRIVVGFTTRTQVNVTIANEVPGFLQISGDSKPVNTSLVNSNSGGPNSNTWTGDLTDGAVYITASHAGMEFVVDVVEHA